MKNRSHKYGIHRPRHRNRHKYTKHKMYLNMVMVICIKEQLSKVWNSIHEKVKPQWGWVEKKSVAYKKGVYQSENHLKGILF